MEVDTIKRAELKEEEKRRKKHIRRTRKLLETKLYIGNLIKYLDTPPLVIYLDNSKNGYGWISDK